ncbi:phosphatidylglycerol lysyltransferase [Streptacidiphilus sp. MAP12-33]|uniref:bifunctional lysylphosphatidylglycerol flippase/synthetase MprF n=1 Tax=Streptacidiphilus sp. MAP12-33 TaxID=3156266 RepID=UPI003511876A
MTSSAQTTTATEGPAAAQAGRLRRIGENLTRWLAATAVVPRLLAKAPLTVTFLVAFWLIGLLTGSIVHGPSDSLLRHVGVGTSTITQGKWWTLFSYGLWASGLTPYIVTTLLALVTLLPAERRLGAVRAGAFFLASQVIGALLGIAAIEVGAVAGDVWLQVSVADLHLKYAEGLSVGASVGLTGVGVVLSAGLTALWRRRTRLLLLTMTVLFLFYAGEVLDIMRAGAVFVGLVGGALLIARRRSLRDVRLLPSSYAETRVLVALLAATSALGPGISWLTGSQGGPLAIYEELFIPSNLAAGEVADACAGAGAGTRACTSIRADYLLNNSVAVVTLFVPLLILAVVALGLARGRRMAWWAAIIFEVCLFAATLRYYFYYRGALASDPTTRTAVTVYTMGLLVVPVAVLVILVLTRHHFGLRAEKGTALTFWTITVLAFVIVGAAYIKFGYDARDQFSPVPTFHQMVTDYPKRLLPDSYLILFGTGAAYAFLPVGGWAKALYELAGPIFWLVVLGGLFVAFWRSGARRKEDHAAEAEALLLANGGSPLSYMTTWPGNEYWISGDGRAAVAYRVIGSIALTMGDPYGEPDARRAAVQGFSTFCDEQGWSPCFYSVTGETKDRSDALGWSAVQVAEDTLLRLPDLEFTGKKWQDVRTALNKAGKAGISGHWYTWPTAPLSVQEQVRALSEEWVADKGLPEMGFTLGGLDELDDQRVRILVATDEEGTLHGITSWLPCYRDGRPVGWTLDFMRRSGEGFRGVMEFLIATAALQFKEEGAEFLSLSGAPLARIDRGEQAVPLQRVLDIAGKALEPVYGFRSLLNFKAKFQPEYHPLYMAYPDPAQLAAIGTAIGKAYLPHTTPAQMVRLSRQFTSS